MKDKQGCFLVNDWKGIEAEHLQHGCQREILVFYVFCKPFHTYQHLYGRMATASQRPLFKVVLQHL